MKEHLFGWENEYAFRVTDSRGRALDRESVLGQITQQARGGLKCLPGPARHGVFLANGARLYLDCGQHMEWCTPECTNPWDVVRYLLAGEQILAELASELRAQNSDVADAAFYRCNVDYAALGSTWGRS